MNGIRIRRDFGRATLRARPSGSAGEPPGESTDGGPDDFAGDVDRPAQRLMKSGDSAVMCEAVRELERAMGQAARQYYRLVILVGAPASGKTTALQTVAQNLGCQLLNVNLELSKKMLELTRTQRSRQVERLLKEVIASVPGDVVLLDNLEILFDTALELQPLRLLQVLDRNRTIVASWNGSFHDETLIYAEPGHPEFQQFKRPEAIVVSVGTTGHH